MHRQRKASEKKAVLFLKKRIKKLLLYVEPVGFASASPGLMVPKVFCFFLSKKKYFLASPVRRVYAGWCQCGKSTAIAIASVAILNTVLDITMEPTSGERTR
jgi:hypothetical protein